MRSAPYALRGTAAHGACEHGLRGVLPVGAGTRLGPRRAEC